MRITVDVDCTPDEARKFLGLPDVSHLQEAMMQQIEDRMKATLSAMEPEALLRAWLPAQVQGMEHFQKLFWSQFGGSKPMRGGSDES